MENTTDPGPTAMLFPGMGPSRFAELGRFLTINRFARQRLAIADDTLGYSLLDRFREAGDEYTEYSQVAFVIASLALAEWAEDEHGVKPLVCAGSSFGERAAAAYSGAMAFPHLVRLVAGVARCEADYFTDSHQDLVSQFIVRTPEGKLDEVLSDLTDEGRWHDVSGRFDNDVHLITLHERDLESFKDRVRRIGGYSLTTMRPAAHSCVLGPLLNRFREEVFPPFRFGDPEIPVVSDQDGVLIQSGDAMRTLLLNSTVNPIRLPELAKQFTALGVTRVIVAGPDLLLHRLDGFKRPFDLVRAGTKDALKPRPRTARARVAVR